jgi:predicted pyridoxine 5'-phosphate oxidase superfamily flavin-nucleotide-binding protein
VGDNAVAGRGFHEGELSVQRRAGVRAEAARLEHMLDRAVLSAGTAKFLAERTLAAITARDHLGRLWSSPLLGPPGFIDVLDLTSVQVAAVPGPGDPLHRPAPGQPIGLLAIDYVRRRRYRLNGTLTAADSGRLTITIEEAFGNCPRYIPRREITAARPASGPRPSAGEPAVETEHLSDADRATITRADTFVLSTTHPLRGNDASHRGGPPGFVRIDGDPDNPSLWWPDYPGNNLFNSLGNLAVDPQAALLFLDFADQTALHVNGTAHLETVPVGAPGDDGHTGRRVSFQPRHVTRSPFPATSVLRHD